MGEVGIVVEYFIIGRGMEGDFVLQFFFFLLRAVVGIAVLFVLLLFFGAVGGMAIRV